MTTIPQQLREIAKHIHECGITKDARRLKGIAAELEAPAADAVPVVAAEHEAGIVRDLEALAADREGDFWPTMLAVGALGIIKRQQRDHLATVSALQARINALEARQEQVRTFLDIAAGEGMELGGVDAGDLYVNIFGYPHPDTSKEQP